VNFLNHHGLKSVLLEKNMTQVKSFTFNPFSENTFILFDDVSRDAIVVDPGCYTTNEQKQLQKFISDNQLIVKRLINTHCHLDHVFGNRFVEETYHVELEAHRAELPVLAKAHISADRFGVSMPMQEPFSIFIEDGDEIVLGDATFKVILAPGHSPGSLCFYNEKEAFLIGGDVLFFRSIGRTDLPGGNSAQLIESITTRLFVLPDATKVFCGHGQPTTIGYERYNNPFLN
jgi:hydroxyacylglutathione hydrolase